MKVKIEKFKVLHSPICSVSWFVIQTSPEDHNENIYYTTQVYIQVVEHMVSPGR